MLTEPNRACDHEYVYTAETSEWPLAHLITERSNKLLIQNLFKSSIKNTLLGEGLNITIILQLTGFSATLGFIHMVA